MLISYKWRSNHPPIWMGCALLWWDSRKAKCGPTPTRWCLQTKTAPSSPFSTRKWWGFWIRGTRIVWPGGRGSSKDETLTVQPHVLAHH